MRSLPVLETQRLLLRGFALSDAARVQELAGDWAIADTTACIPHPYEDGMAEAWIASHEEELATGTGAPFAITDTRDGTLIGAISLMRIAAGHKAELGYWIGKPYWSCGYCTEACRAVLAYAFGTLGLQRVYAHHMARNPASGRVMQKAGMSHEGTLRQHLRKGERFEDVELYGILRSEWEGIGAQVEGCSDPGNGSR